MAVSYRGALGKDAERVLSSSSWGGSGRRSILAVLLVCFAGLLHADDVMEIPGGRDAVGRLFGHVDLSDEGFAASLNRVLLDTIDESHDRAHVLNRVRLHRFLDTVTELGSRFPGEIRLDGKAALENRFREVAEFLGYRVEPLGRGVSLQPRPGERWAQRREVARALGWDLLAVARDLGRDESRTLAVRTERAAALLPFDRWFSVTGKEIDPTNALRRMIDDQRLGLLVAGLEQVSAETADFLDDGELLRRIYRQASIPFFRYAAALEIRQGALRYPGGEKAAPVWNELLGVKRDGPAETLRRLLEESPPRALHLWHALYFSPPPVTSYYLGSDGEDREREEPFLRALHTRLMQIDDRAALSSARGEGQGVPALLRSLALDDEGTALDLPGGLNLWLAAVRGEVAPESEEELNRIAARAQRKDLDDRTFFLRVLKADVESSVVKQSALPRLIRTVGLFGDRPELLTPENVILVNRAVEAYPLALQTLERMELSDPRSVGNYLRVVARLDAARHGPLKFVAISNFQGGVELLRILGSGGRLESTAVETLLQEWLTLHLDFGDPGALAPYQLDWLDRLLEQLPEVGSEEPGRGPLERKLLAALTGRKDPQRLRWRGLDYEAYRGRDVASRLVGHVRRQEIPPVDELVGLHRGFAELKERSRASDLEGVRTIASRLIESLNRLSKLRAAGEAATFRDWIEPVNRARASGILRRFQSQKAAKKLPRMTSLAHQAETMLAREIRPFFAASSYLECMGHLESLLFLETGLIHRHTMINTVASARPIPLDTPWIQTDVVPSGRSPVGTRVVGHLGGVPRSLIQYHVSQSDDLQLLEHQKILFADWLTTPWSRITADDARLVETLIRAGEALLHRTDPAAAEFVGRRVPIRRLERYRAGEATISISECFSIGLALSVGDAYGPARPDLLEPALRERLTELSGGDDPRPRLHRIGGATPALNGRGRRWVGSWPPYESVQNEAGLQPVIERELADLRLAVVAYLGRRGFPGEVGADLMLAVLEEMPRELKIETGRDWSGFVDWTDGMDDDYFDGRMRRCLARGLYRLQDS